MFVYRLITKDTVEEKIIERQAIKLKLDQIIIQKGSQAISNKLSKDEFEQFLLNGASTLMK